MASVIRGSDNFDSVGGNAVKAWVNFIGTGTVSIRDAHNVSSITDGGVGVYTVNFAAALSDANYAVFGSTSGDANAVVTVSEQNNSAVTRDPASINSIRLALVSVSDVPVAVDRYSVSVMIVS